MGPLGTIKVVKANEAPVTPKGPISHSTSQAGVRVQTAGVVHASHQAARQVNADAGITSMVPNITGNNQAENAQALTPEQIQQIAEAMKAGVLFPGSEKALENTSANLEAGYSTVLAGVFANAAAETSKSGTMTYAQYQKANFNKAVLSGVMRTASIAALLVGMPSVAFGATEGFGAAATAIMPIISKVLGGATLYGVISTAALSKCKDPNSIYSKVFGFGARVLPWAAGLYMITGSLGLASGGGLFMDVIQSSAGKYAILGELVGATGLWATISTIRYKQAVNHNMSTHTPFKKSDIFRTAFLGNAKLFSGTHYLGYRALLTAAFIPQTIMFYAGGNMIGAGICLFAGLLAVGIRIANPHPFKYTSKEQEKTQIGLGRAFGNYTVRTALMYAPLLALGALMPGVLSDYFTDASNYSGFQFAADVATIHTSLMGLKADIRPAFHSMLSAVDWERSMFNKDENYISEANRAKLTDRVNRLVAYVPEAGRTISKAINMFIQEYSGVQVQLCGETNIYAGLNAVRNLRAGKNVLGQISSWQREIYVMFQAAYANMPTRRQLENMTEEERKEAVRQSTEALIKVLEKLSGSFYHEEGNQQNGSFYNRLKEEIERDMNENPNLPNGTISPDRRFDLEAEQPAFIRNAFFALKNRGYELGETARELKMMGDLDVLTFDHVDSLFKEFLGVYSVQFNHILRKEDGDDDAFISKTMNVSWTWSHFGDTLYQVWDLDSDNNKPTRHIPGLFVRINNPAYDNRKHKKDASSIESKKYLWIRRQDYLKVLGTSASMSKKYQFVDNTPKHSLIKNLETFLEGGLTVEGKELKGVQGFASDLEELPAHGLIDWEGQDVTVNSSRVLIASQDMSATFQRNFKAWAERTYGADYSDWAKKNGALWHNDRPQVLVIDAAHTYYIADEDYIVLTADSRMQLELKVTEEKDALLRVVNYDENIAEFPNPDPSRDVDRIKGMYYEDALIGIRYTVGGKDFNIPYKGVREDFITLNPDLDVKSAWQRIDHGVIRQIDPNGGWNIENCRIVVCAKDGTELGVIKNSWPTHMHPAALIEKNAKGEPRIELDVFAERRGMATWLVVDYGDNYRDANDTNKEQLYNTRRYAVLDFDKEAKQQFWPNFTSIESINGGKKIRCTSVSTNTSTRPFDKKAAGIGAASEIEKVSAAIECSKGFVDPTKHTWSPFKDKDHTIEVKEGLLLLRDKTTGEERYVEASGLGMFHGTAGSALRTIKVETNGNGLDFIKLRISDPTRTDPSFIYRIPTEKYNSFDKELIDPSAVRLKALLKRDDLTAKIRRNDEGHYIADLYDGVHTAPVHTVDLSARSLGLYDNEGKGFLRNAARDMGSMESFYQSSDNTYKGTEEWRPVFKLINGEINLILTKVEHKIVSGKGVEKALQFSLNMNADMFYVVPTSASKVLKTGAAKEQWVPMTLAKPINYKGTRSNFGNAIIRTGDNDTRYVRLEVPKGLPDMTCMIKYENLAGKKEDARMGFAAYTLKINDGTIEGETRSFREKQLVLVKTDAPISDALQKKLARNLSEAGVVLSDTTGLIIDVFHTREPEVINGQWHSIVHGQRQHGTFNKDESLPGAEQAQYRDEYFYAITRELFSEAIPPGAALIAPGAQTGKGTDKDGNLQYRGKPIENGSPFLGVHRHLFEMVEVLHGLPKGMLLAAATTLDRAGGWERMQNNEHYKKLEIYCREKGWLSGVSEDEQGMLALALALGYSLKYHLKVVAFESQPESYGKSGQQDTDRYPSAMQLAKDVLVPYEMREVGKWLRGENLDGTLHKILEHFAFRDWYNWSKEDITRKSLPLIFMGTGGAVRPYLIDPMFIMLYGVDFLVGVAMYTNQRRMLGRNRESTGMSAISWAMGKGPSMNAAYLVNALKKSIEMYEIGIQYGSFTVTSQQSDKLVPVQAARFLRMIMIAQGLGLAAGLIATMPSQIGLDETSKIEGFWGSFGDGYFLNEFWTTYDMLINMNALKYIKACDDSLKNGTALKQKINNAAARNDELFAQRSDEFLKALRLLKESLTRYEQNDRVGANALKDQAKEVLRGLVLAQHENLNTAIRSEQVLQALGVSRQEVKKLIQAGKVK